MLIEITYNVTDVYMSTTETPVYVEISFEQPGSASAVWGSITGTLSNQTDLQNALNLKVPYTGATTNVNLGEYELKAGQVTLDTSPTGTAAVGTIRWNDTTGTSETTLKGGNVIIKNGVDLVARVVNKVSPNTTLTKAAYQAVRVSGAQGQRLAVAFAQANNDANSADTIGIVIETIPTNQEGFIMTVGQLEGINTTGSLQGETWVDGDVLYLSPTTAGALTNIKPTAVTGHIVVIGYVEYAHANNGKIYVKVMNGWELDELHNVSIVSPANNQGIFYNSTSLLWENKTISTALGYTPVPTTRNITINGVTYDLSADRTYTISTGISGSGAAGQVTYWTGASAVSGSTDFLWDNTSKALIIQNTNSSSFSDIALASNGGVNVRGLHLYAFGSTYSGVGAFSPSYVALSTGASVARLAYVAFGSTAWYTGGSTAANERMQLTSTGNLLIGFTTDQATRLAVSGDTLLRGSGNTNSTLVLTAQNSDSANVLRVFNGGSIGIGSSADRPIIFPFTTGVGSPVISGTNLAFYNYTNTQSAANGAFGFENTAAAQTSGQNSFMRLSAAFVPTSGTGAYTQLLITGTINQTGGANGITRGLYVNPTLTAAADFRAIETTAGNVLFGSNFFWDNTNSRLGIGTNAPSTALHVIGDLTIRGSGATSGSFGFTLYKSNGQSTFTIRNDGFSILYGNYQIASQLPYLQLTPSAWGSSFYLQSGVNIAANAAGDYTDFLNPVNRGYAFIQGSTASMVIAPTTSNVSIGTTSDLGVRLGVVGDTILRGSGATSATTALTVQNSSSTNLFTVRNDGAVAIGTTLSAWSGSTTPLQISGGAFWNFGSTNIYLGLNYYFNGSSRIYIQSAAASEYRQASGGHYWYSAISGTAGGTVSFTETMRLNADGYLGIGTTVPTALTHLGASTTTRASLRISSGTAPTTPNDGDIWFDGTDIKMRIGGVTKTFTLI